MVFINFCMYVTVDSPIIWNARDSVRIIRVFCDICSLVKLVVLVFSAQFLQPRLFQYLIFVDLGVVTKVGTMVSFIGMFGVFGCSIIVDKLRLVFKLMGHWWR